MARQVALVTGAGGEMGHDLIPALVRNGFEVIALDLELPPQQLRDQCIETVAASILDIEIVSDLFRRHRPAHLFHLAAVLSGKAERDPDLAHRVNVEGTYGLFGLCREQAESGAPPVRFFFPSSIAVYGLPDAATKQRAGAVGETEWTVPRGMYGCNKLYSELMGSYFAGADRQGFGLDFRAIRFPGLISSETLPSGGTTDYAPEMIHAAAQGKPYTCFVEEGSSLPFMTMPDAVAAILRLASADAASLSTRIYNIRGFGATAGELHAETLKHFPAARIDYRPDPRRQALVDGWPADVDDTPARRDWGLAPRHGLAEAFADYLVPALRRRYGVDVGLTR